MSSGPPIKAIYVQVKATAVAGAVLMLLAVLLDITATEGWLLQQYFGSRLVQVVFLIASWALGLAFIKSPNIDTESKPTIRTLYIYFGGLLLIALFVAAVHLSQ